MTTVVRNLAARVANHRQEINCQQSMSPNQTRKGKEKSKSSQNPIETILIVVHHMVAVRLG